MRQPLSGEVQTELARELSGGERLLWSGQPLGGIRLRVGDLLLVPFSLVWCGFALFWEWSVVRRGGPIFMQLWGLPFVLVGLYIVAGRFLADAWLRRRTVYARTSERVLILSTGFRRSVTSLQLRTLPELTLRESRSGVGTIAFGAAGKYSALYDAMGAWPGAQGHLGPRFELLRNVRQVHEEIRAAQRASFG